LALYGFVGNSPVNWIDTLGLDWQEPKISGGIGPVIDAQGTTESAMSATLEIKADSSCGNGKCYRVVHIATHSHPTVHIVAGSQKQYDTTLKHELRHVQDLKIYGYQGLDLFLKSELVYGKKCFADQNKAAKCKGTFENETVWYYETLWRYITVENVDLDEMPWNPMYWIQLLSLESLVKQKEAAMNQAIQQNCAQ